MKQPEYTIADRYQVYTALHLIRDKVSGADTRLEPRLMQVLELLVAGSGNLVSRELLIKEVWDNYGGASEALNHAIALLRKTLQDTEKNLIQTVPKKGYTMKAAISYPPSTIPKKSKILLPFGIAIIIAIVATFWWLERPITDKTVPYKKVNAIPEETIENTIETSAPDGTHYKLIVIGDSPPSFYINGKLQMPDSMEKHHTLIYQLEQELSARRNMKRK